jgi:hypothetical protein
MPKAKKKAKPRAQAVRNTKANRARAIKELGINRPFYTCRVIGNQLEFRLYGGDVVYWPPLVEEEGG